MNKNSTLRNYNCIINILSQRTLFHETWNIFYVCRKLLARIYHLTLRRSSRNFFVVTVIYKNTHPNFDCHCCLSRRWNRREKRREKRNVCGDKVRGFYRPPAVTTVVGRRKLLALVANDHRLGGRPANCLLAASLNILMNNIRVINDTTSQPLYIFSLLSVSLVHCFIVHFLFFIQPGAIMNQSQ